MLRPVVGRLFGIGRTEKSRSHRLQARVEGLEFRSLLTAGSVVQSGGLVTITPASSGTNVAIVSYQNVNGTTEVGVNLNGTNFDFSLTQVGFIYYEGAGVGGSQTFQNMTSLHTVAWGGSGSNLFESSGGARTSFSAARAATRLTLDQVLMCSSVVVDRTHSTRAPRAPAKSSKSAAIIPLTPHRAPTDSIM